MKSHRLEKTKDANLFRVVDREGDWKTYYYKPGKNFLSSITHILGTGFAKTERFHNYLLATTKEESKIILKATGERGDRIHKAIADISTGGYVKRSEIRVPSREAGGLVELTDDEWETVLAFADFWNAHEPVVLASEFPSYNVKNGFAGTCDLAWILTKKCDVISCSCDRSVGKVGLCDIKTGGGPYEWWASQLAAYANGENISGMLKGELPSYAMNLRIGTRSERGWAAYYHGGLAMNKAVKLFFAAKTISEELCPPFDEKSIVTIPDEVILKVTKKAKLKKAKRKKTTKKGTKK